MQEEALIAWLEEKSKEKGPAEDENLEVKRTVRYTPSTAAEIDRIAELEGLSTPAVIRLLCRTQLNEIKRGSSALDRLYEIICEIACLLPVDEEEISSEEDFSGHFERAREEGYQLYKEAREVYENHRVGKQ